MPNDSIDDALKEVYALAPSDQVGLNALEVSHPLLTTSLWMVSDRDSWDLTLENGIVQTFDPVPFKDQLPASGENGITDYAIGIDNIDRQVTDFLDKVKGSTDPVKLTRRQYLASDPTNLLGTPLVLFLSSAQVTAFSVQGRASFGDPVNKNHPSEKYTRQQFPSLA